jgi:hypothetical protein
MFDAITVESPATFDDPELPPSGIRYVSRNGCLVDGVVPLL